MEQIDAEILITLVEARPVLWDKTLETYKDRTATKNAWREVCLVLKPDFDVVDEKERNIFGKDVIRRWTNIRDSFVKSLIKMKDMKKSGSVAKRMRKYIYSDQLQFLKKMYDSRDTEDNIQWESAAGMEEHTETPACTENVNNFSDSCNTPSRQLPSKRVRKEQSRRHRKPDEVEMAMLRALEGEKPCSKTSFLLSLKPHLEKFDEQDYLQFQLGVLKVIEKINERKKNISSASTPLTQYTLSLPPNQVFHAAYSSSPMGKLAPSYHSSGSTNPGLSRPQQPTSTAQFYQQFRESLSSEADNAISLESNSDSIDFSS